MTEAIIHKYFADLVGLLPMNDATFRAKLYSAGLLPGDMWSKVKSESTKAEKAEHFLFFGIQNDTDNFNKLLTIMEECDDDRLKKLAEKICREPDIRRPLSKRTKIDSAGMLNEAQAKLRKGYENLCNSDSPHHYVQLALVRDEICDIDMDGQKLNEITRHTLHGQVDEILKMKEPLKRGLEDIFHYNNLLCPRLILILGAPGIGKSTLANEICDKWATSKDHFLSNDYDLVILIRLRTLQERTLQQVMIEAVGSEVAYDELLSKSHGERCLIILEGLDEISADWQKNDKMFNQLVKTTNFLSHANIIVTSRPHACINLGYYTKYHSRTIEIVGFDKSQIKEYAEWFFQSLNTVEKFMEQVNGDPHISSLCYVPLCLNMVLKSFKHNNKTIHTTLTKLYQAFIISQVEEHIRLNKAMPLGTVLKSEQNYITNLTAVLDDVPCVLSEEALETLFLLSKLAYKSYFQWFNNMERSPKIIYSSKDLACCNITDLKNDACGLLKATNTLFYASNTAVYSFNHLSVQEYFCALYISLLPEDEQLQLLKDHITDYPHMWPFYAGITKLRSSKTLHNLSQFLIHDKELFEENILIYCWMVSKDPMKIMEATVALNSLYEAQVSSDDCIDHLVSLYMSGHTLSQYDYTSIFYLVSVAPITCLHLRNCHIGDQQLEVLSATCRPTLKVLDLCWNNITDKGVESLIRITNLTHFSAVHNPIGNAGIQVFSLKYLVQLNISIVGMTAVDTCALSRCFKVSNSLHSLEIGGNGVKDGGITGILNNLPSTLVRLVISGCDLTHNGAENISNILKMNKTLKHLEISSNSIGDDGILAISDSLCVNKTLIQLVACDCQFHSKGAESIAKMLQINETLKYLDISNNQIGDDGTTAVALSVQANATLILLNISNCGFCNQGAEKIAEILRVNKTLKCLEISENYVKDSKMSALASSIQASNTLIKLRLSETRHKTHEFTNETLRLIHESHCSNESGGYLDAVFSSKEMEFEEWFIYDSINGMKRSYCLPAKYVSNIFTRSY